MTASYGAGQGDAYRPATARQMNEIRRLSERLGKPPARTDLTRLEASQYLADLHRLNDRGEPWPAPVPDPELQPGETLRWWFPYRRTAERLEAIHLA